MTIVTKPTNPKDAIGDSKLHLELVPDTMVNAASLAFLEGALKYGRFNWRAAGVRSSIYVAAARRHIAKYWNGEDCDPQTGVLHLASAIACLGIIIDAEEADRLTDDRPPALPDFSAATDAESDAVKHLQKLFEGHTPHQYTIHYQAPTCPTTLLEL